MINFVVGLFNGFLRSVSLFIVATKRDDKVMISPERNPCIIY